jgi:hypothetical protein
MSRRGGVLTVVAAVVWLGAPRPSSAQVQPAGSFDELQLFAKPGDKILVGDSNGKTSRGNVVQLTDASLALQIDNSTRQFSEADVTEVRQRLRDSLKNGWLIGTAIGVGAGIANVSYNCSHYGSCRSADIGVLGLDTGLGMLLGTVVDASIRKTSVVFQRRETATISSPTNSVSSQSKPARTFADLRALARYGERVEVVELNGTVWKGEIVGLSSRSVRVSVAGTTHEWDEAQIREIKKRKKDLWWNGALIGMGAGALTGTLLGASSCGDYGECLANAVPAGLFGGMAIGLTAGALIDFSIRKMETAFQLPNTSLRPTIGLTPILTRDRQGLSLSVKF